MIEKCANKIMWVERWLMQFGKDGCALEGITADKTQNGKWISKVELPLINKTIKVTSSKEVNAMLNVAEQCTKIIKEYLDNHLEIYFQPLSACRNWVIISDEEGNFKEMHLTDKARKRIGEQLMDMEEKSLKAVEQAVAKIKRTTGSTKNLFIQVMDRACFPEGSDDREIQRIVCDNIWNDYGTYTGIVTKTNGEHVITVGYLLGD